jgi:two-component system, chemotaxis family, protein-glutamate methylesterase/glutaminase
MARIRVLVVEDSLTVRRHLCEVLAADPDLEVVGEAVDGKQAIEMCLALRPDVVTMDMMLPVMTGLAATEYIMAHCPTPILVVSSSMNRSELFKTYDAMAAGAVDVLDKPPATAAAGSWEHTFVGTVKLVSRIRVITHLRGRMRPPPPSVVTPRPAVEATASSRVVAIGASTGGPGAIVELLRCLPPDFDAPLLFAMHIHQPFAPAFVQWLDAQSSRRVAFARDGERVSDANGRVVMAPPDLHLEVRDGRFRLGDGPERHSCRPSVDVLFESVAVHYGASAVGCLLTGMGRDGALGLLRIREAGGQTIAQDETSCIVYGMPREAVQLGAVLHSLPLSDIGAKIGELAAAANGGRR